MGVSRFSAEPRHCPKPCQGTERGALQGHSALERAQHRVRIEVALLQEGAEGLESDAISLASMVFRDLGS